MSRYALGFFTWGCVLACVSSVLAVPLDVISVDGPQDLLSVNGAVHELGNQPPFPVEEWIDSAFIMWTDETACFDGSDVSGINNALVSITNMTGRAWDELYYVADPETTITNFDGWVNSEEAFKIDYVGINRPLISESIVMNGIFEVGETWEFIIQDYANALGGPAHAFDSIGIAGASTGWPPSTGSIITPEPATICLLALGAAFVVGKRRKQQYLK